MGSRRGCNAFEDTTHFSKKRMKSLGRRLADANHIGRGTGRGGWEGVTFVSNLVYKEWQEDYIYKREPRNQFPLLTVLDPQNLRANQQRVVCAIFVSGLLSFRTYRGLRMISLPSIILKFYSVLNQKGWTNFTDPQTFVTAQPSANDLDAMIRGVSRGAVDPVPRATTGDIPPEQLQLWSAHFANIGISLIW